MALSLVFLLLSRPYALVDLTKWLQMVLRLCLPGLQLDSVQGIVGYLMRGVEMLLPLGGHMMDM